MTWRRRIQMFVSESITSPRNCGKRLDATLQDLEEKRNRKKEGHPPDIKVTTKNSISLGWKIQGILPLFLRASDFVSCGLDAVFFHKFHDDVAVGVLTVVILTKIDKPDLLLEYEAGGKMS